MGKRNFNLLFLALTYFSLIPTLLLSQVDTAWVRRYNGPENSEDLAYGLAVDAESNVYVFGYGRVTRPEYSDFILVKYDAQGNVQWVKTYDGPGNQDEYGYAIAIDDSGYIYVTGPSYGGSYDYATIKYNANGDTVWVRRYDGTGYSHDYSRAIAVDNHCVYVTGQSIGPGTSYDYATIKYNAKTGDTIWIRRYNGPGNGAENAYAIAVDALGNVYVTGYSTGLGTGYDYATIKYNAHGETVWVRRYGGSSDDYAYAIAVDNSGNVYVTGMVDGDYVTIKYNPNGETVWVRRYNGPGNSEDRAFALAIDNLGNVYVTGRSYGSGTSYDYATIKYNAQGNQLWVQRYNGPGNDEDCGYRIAVDNSGNVYVTGWSTGSGSRYDYATIKYNPNGEVQWIARYNGPGNDLDYARAIVVDSNGNIYVTGESFGVGCWRDFATIKYVELSSADEIISKALTYSLPINTKILNIYNPLGKLVKDKKLKKGVYFLKTEKENKKIVILK